MGLDGDQILNKINSAQETAYQEFPRTYLGMSSLGRPCAREIWYSWRWFKPEKFSPRIKRLFSRGHQEEPRFVDMFRLIGMTVQDVDLKTGKQFEFISSNGHCMGHCDGVGLFPGSIYLLEFKTHSYKSFVAVKKSQSIKISKWDHYCQCQRYMHELKLKYGVYCAVNKNDDALYFEVIKRDKKTVAWILERENELVNATAHPGRISDDPSFWICSYCWYKDVCFETEMPMKNCRTCSDSLLGDNGTWLCQKRKRKSITISDQLKGCEMYSRL